jgi:PKD repeat protein
MNKLYYRVSFDILKRTIVLLSILYLSLTNITYGQAWTQLTWSGSTPAPRQGHTAVYDATNNLMTIFGGDGGNDVWVLVNANGLGGANFWEQLISNGNTPSAPSTRSEHTAVYDATNNRMIIFGGFSDDALNDVWVLSTANGLGGTPAWTQLFPNPDPTQTTNGYGGLPEPRYGHTAVYDATNNRMIIFSGLNSDNYLNDVWVLSNANGLDNTTSAWTQVSPIGSAPAGRTESTAVYDTTNNRMTIFAGNNGGTLVNDVWVLSTANGLDGTPAWTQLFPNPDPLYGLPTARWIHTAIYDDTDNRMTIFGGVGAQDLNDVWVLSNANGLEGTTSWTKLFPTGSTPTTRAGHTAIYDTANNRMTIFGGGHAPYLILNDVWVLSNADKLSVPNAGFYGIPTSGIVPLTVSFVDTSAFTPTSWNWNFGDGINTGFTLSSTTTHTYGNVTAPTSYTVQLVVSNSFGTSTSTQANYIYVYETALNASFTGTPLLGYSPLTVYFSDSSYIYGSNPSWNWSFGDGSTSNVQNPIHIYGTVASATAYTVQLIVTTSLGTSTSTQNNYVIVLPKPSVEDWMLYSYDLKDTFISPEMKLTFHNIPYF